MRQIKTIHNNDNNGKPYLYYLNDCEVVSMLSKRQGLTEALFFVVPFRFSFSLRCAIEVVFEIIIICIINVYIFNLFYFDNYFYHCYDIYFLQPLFFHSTAPILYLVLFVLFHVILYVSFSCLKLTFRC